MKALSLSKPLNVLVLAVGSPLGQSICKALRMSNLPVKVITADSDPLSAGLYVDEQCPRVVLPLVKNPDYLAVLVDVIKEHHIQVIFPVIGPEFAFFHDNRTYFEQENIQVVSVEKAVLDRCNDKYEGMRYLREKGVSVPDTTPCVPGQVLEDFLARNRFPLFIKPRYGASGRHVYVVEGRDQLAAFQQAFPPGYFVAQTYLGDGDEYTVGVYMARDRSFRSAFVMKRQLKFGLSYKGEVVESPAINHYCMDLCDEMGLYYASNVQLKLVNGAPQAFEINPRLSSTACIRAAFGFNEPEMILRELAGDLAGHEPRPSSGKFLRYWEEMYLDLAS
jgi:carbamoyl-phosphate synthase large subunit